MNARLLEKPCHTDRDTRYWDPTPAPYLDPDTDVWQVHRRADVVLIDTDPRFSVDLFTDEQRRENNPAMAGFWMAEGPRQQALRVACADFFSPAAVARLAPFVAAATAATLDRLGAGRVELVSQVAEPISDAVICEVLGIDVSHASYLRGARDLIPNTDAGLLVPAPHLWTHFNALVQTHRNQPRSGLLGHLLDLQAHTPQPGGAGVSPPMQDREIAATTAMMLWASIGSGTAQLSQALLDALTHRGPGGVAGAAPWWHQLAAQPTVIDGFLRESMRWYPVFPVIWRIALEDVMFGEVTVPAGAYVAGLLTAANRDEETFPDPHRFDPARSPNPHLTLGRGRHYCLGGQLGVTIARTVLTEAVGRWPNLRLDTASRWVGVEDSLRTVWAENG